jgi:hypothetical protein
VNTIGSSGRPSMVGFDGKLDDELRPEIKGNFLQAPIDDGRVQFLGQG